MSNVILVIDVCCLAAGVEVNLSSAVREAMRNLVYVIFPTGGEIRKRGREVKEKLHVLAMLQFIVLSALACIAVTIGLFLLLPSLPGCFSF